MSVTPLQTTPTPPGGRAALQRGHWIAIGVLAVVEIGSALYLALMNPVQGYDENWYLINAYRFRGVDSLPYVANRPPMLPMLLALLGDHYRILSGLAHIAATGVIFAIFRRLVSPWTAIAGTAVFMVCGDIRLYNMLQLTEMPAVLAEVACISNDREARLLGLASYRQSIADALYSGIKGYAREMSASDKGETT